MANVRIKDLSEAASPSASEFVAIDAEVGGTRKTTLTALVTAGRPLANQAEAEAGVEATKAMTPVTTKQAIEAIGDGRFASADQGALADTSLQPADIGATVQAQDALLDSVSALSLVAGDLISATGASAVARLPIGSDGQVLSVVGGALAYRNVPATDLPDPTTANTVLWRNADDSAYEGKPSGATGLLALAAEDGTDAADVLSYAYSVKHFGAVGDGVTDDTSAFNTALALGVKIYVPAPDVAYRITGPLIFTTGSALVGDESGSLVETTVSNIASPTGVSGVSLENIVFRGQHSTTTYHFTITDCSHWRIKAVRVENANSGFDVVNSTDFSWDDVFLKNVRGTGIKFRGGSKRHIMRSIKNANARNFTVLVEDASQIDIFGLHRWYDASDITSYLAGQVSSGRLGNEALGVRYTGSYVRVFGYYISDVHENSISFTGSNNEAHGGHINNGSNTGIHLYGRDNIVVGGEIKNCLGAGVQISASAGGIARRNRVIGVLCEANEYGVRVSADTYATWTSGGATSTNYCKSVSGSITRIYASASGAVSTFGTIQPVHESGTQSDGVNDWTYITRVINGETLDATENTIVAPMCRSNASGDYVDSTSAASNNCFLGTANESQMFRQSPDTGTTQQFVTSDTLSPQFHQSRKRSTGNGDVTTGSVLAKWDASGWLNGARRFAMRFTWFVASAAGSIVRAKGKINVTNAAGVDWPAFHFSEEGYLGIGNASTFTENDPQCSADIEGQIAGNVLGHRTREDVTISSGAIDVTGKGYVRVTAAGTITDITTSDPHCPEVFITAQTGTVTITHNSSKIRCRGGVNQSIVANEGGLRFKRVTGNIWEQMG